MKYFIYLSDAKIEMLSKQIAFQPRTSSESTFKLGFKDFAGWEGKTTTEESQLKFKHLENVLKRLRKESSIGTVEAPKQFVEGVCPMRWGIYGIANRHPLKDLGDKAPVVFHARVGDTLFLMYGSPKHLTGRENCERVDAIWSAADVIHYALSDVVEKYETPSENELLEQVGKWIRAASYAEQLELIWRTVSYELKSPEQQLEFVAKKIVSCQFKAPTKIPVPKDSPFRPIYPKHYEQRQPTQIVFASPLYVALVE